MSIKGINHPAYAAIDFENLHLAINRQLIDEAEYAEIADLEYIEEKYTLQLKQALSGLNEAISTLDLRYNRLQKTLRNVIGFDCVRSIRPSIINLFSDCAVVSSMAKASVRTAVQLNSIISTRSQIELGIYMTRYGSLISDERGHSMRVWRFNQLEKKSEEFRSLQEITMERLRCKIWELVNEVSTSNLS